MKSAQEILLNGLAKYDTSVLLIGGMALPAFDVVRQTIDLDCLIAVDDESLLRTVLVEAGYNEIERSKNFVRYVSASIYHYDIDVLMVDQKTFDSMISCSSAFDMGHNTIINVPSISHMIMLKLHAIKNNKKRELKDLSDIVEILRNNVSEISDAELETICSRYGPEGVYKRIQEAV